MKKRGFKKGQSILEYTLLLATIIAVIVAVLLGNGGIKGKIESAYNATGSALEDTTSALTGGIFGSESTSSKSN